MRTQKEIDLEIKRLERCKTYAPRLNIFGEDNHAKIDEQIGTLGNKMTVDQVYDAPYSDEGNEDAFNESIRDAALHAAQWLAGEDNEAPSSGWDNFKPKKK